jgi:cell division septum initiation protein DivIVA
MGELIGIDYDAMKKENEELKRKNAQLTKRVEELEGQRK